MPMPTPADDATESSHIMDSFTKDGATSAKFAVGCAVGSTGTAGIAIALGIEPSDVVATAISDVTEAGTRLVQ